MPNKKSFKDDINPALRFISQPISSAETASLEKNNSPPQGFKHNPIYVETKSRRLQLLVQPSLHEKLKNRASIEGKSVNDLVHSILTKFMDQSFEN